MWRSIDIRAFPDPWEMPYNIEIMCCHAVDLSQGQLEEINIEHFGSDNLLVYISRRSSQLRRLRLVCCYGTTPEGLAEAVKGFPLLEELHLYYTCIDERAMKAVGRSCPLLKSFKMNRGVIRPRVESNWEALAVTENMPRLQHLQLFGNKLTDEGLLAILDGCPRLESLDLRQCFNVSFGGHLEILCSQRIKDLRRPYDSTNDYGFDVLIIDEGSIDEDYPYLQVLSDFDEVSDYDEEEFSSEYELCD